jgi:ribosomal protein S6--L-glutamate ligase
MKSSKVALAPFLRSCTGITTLGIRPNIDDYSAEEKALLCSAERVFFPTPRFAYLFSALQIPTFPRYTTYQFQRSRVLQEILLAHMAVTHPATRIYFGKKQKAGILEAFPFPFLATGPHPSLHSRQLVENVTSLDECCRCYNPLIIQRAINWSENLRVLCVGSHCVGVLRRSGPPGSNDQYEPVPLGQQSIAEVLRSTLSLVSTVHLDDIVLEWGYGEGRWQLIEMTRPPVRWAAVKGTLNRHHYICRLVQDGRL